MTTLTPEQADALIEALTHAAATFREYAQIHRDKGTPDGDHKAENNARHAMRCELALDLARQQTRAAEAAWRPIESAPRDGTWVLVLESDGEQHVALFRTGLGCWCINGIAYPLEPTAWQTLPASLSAGDMIGEGEGGESDAQV